MSKFGIVNVRMVITEEKILSNISKVQKMIDPNSKKQIIQLEDDAFFKDLVESIKTYLIEYPKKKNFPASVYKAAYGLVEFATNEFEENTKQIEELIRQREINISLANELKNAYKIIASKQDGWKEEIKGLSPNFGDDIKEAFEVIAKSKATKSQAYQDAIKLLKARVSNLESNLHIEIDMERIEDRSKALSYRGIEVADALKLIPAPQNIEDSEQDQQLQEQGNNINQLSENAAIQNEDAQYYESTRIDVKPSLWQRIKNSKLVRALTMVTRIRIVVDTPALPSGDESKR